MYQFQLELNTAFSYTLGLEEASNHARRCRFTELPGSGHIVVKGQKTDDAPWTLYEYKLDRGRIQKVREVKQTCGHETCTPELLGVVVEGEDLVAVSCWECGDIKLVNMDTGETHTAYKIDRPDFMCQPGRIWLSCLVDPTVRELDCTTKTFVLTGNQVSAEQSHNILYLTAPYKTLVLYHYGWIEAISCDTGQQIWKMNKAGATANIPRGLVLHSKHKLLVFANPKLAAVLLLDPVTGSTICSLSLHRWGHVWELCVTKDQLLILHGKGEQLCISQVEMIHTESGN